LLGISRYDADGNEVAFDNDMYLDRVENDPDQAANPYRSLYKGFEREWAFYKVREMVVSINDKYGVK
jgi:hypothetical protein